MPTKKDDRKIDTKTEDKSPVVSVETPVVGDKSKGDGAKTTQWPYDKPGQRGHKGID